MANVMMPRTLAESPKAAVSSRHGRENRRGLGFAPVQGLVGTVLSTSFVALAAPSHAQTQSITQAQPQATSQTQMLNTQSVPTAGSPPPSKDQSAVSEVIVTATRRPLQLNAVPASITALSSQNLQENHVVQAEDLNGIIPTLQVRPNNNDVGLYIRGVGHPAYSPQAENSIALNLDGVYLSRPSEGLNAFFDVSRVEVLAGPQGTLYGRNATGGVINVISSTPTRDDEGYVSIGGGNYARGDVEGVFSGPVSDDVQIRIGGYEHRRFDGFGQDFTTNTPNGDLDEHGGKASIAFEPTDKLTFTLRADAYQAKDHYGGYFYDGPSGRLPITTLQSLGGLVASDQFDNYSNVPNDRNVVLGGVSLESAYKVSADLTLKSLTSFRYDDSKYETDIDGSQLVYSALYYKQHADHFSQELDATMNVGHLFGNVGLYYFGEVNESSLLETQTLYYRYTSQGLPIPAYIPHQAGATGFFAQDGDGRTNAEAAFANFSYDLTNRLTLGAGLRYSYETKENTGAETQVVTPFIPFKGTRDSNGLTPAFNASYKLTQEVNLYASITRGFKSGEFIAGTSDYAKPEFVWDYEGGVKGRFLNNRLNLTFGGFYYDYSDLQVEILQGESPVLINSPKATLYGVEGIADLSLPYDWTVATSFSALHTELKDLISADPDLAGSPLTNLSGNQFPNAPTAQVNLAITKKVNWGHGGDGLVSLNYSWQGSTYLDIYNVKENSYRPAYALLNFSYLHTLPGAHWSVLIWGRNLTDKIVVNTDSVSTTFNQQDVNYSDPRTFGATIKYKF